MSRPTTACMRSPSEHPSGRRAVGRLCAAKPGATHDIKKPRRTGHILVILPRRALARWRKIGRGGSYTLNTGLASFIAAAAFAARKHRDQRRKGADSAPYINHPIAVANVLANEAAVTDPITLSAALLHDTVEDTCTTVEELRIQFGADVAL